MTSFAKGLVAGPRDIKRYLLSLKKTQHQAQNEISEILDRVRGDKFPDDDFLYGVTELGFHGWDCEESPFAICAYDTIDDPAMDQCIFCGLPQERK